MLKMHDYWILAAKRLGGESTWVKPAEVKDGKLVFVATNENDESPERRRVHISNWPASGAVMFHAVVYDEISAWSLELEIDTALTSPDVYNRPGHEFKPLQVTFRQLVPPSGVSTTDSVLGWVFERSLASLKNRRASVSQPDVTIPVSLTMGAINDARRKAGLNVIPFSTPSSVVDGSERSLSGLPSPPPSPAQSSLSTTTPTAPAPPSSRKKRDA